MKEKNKRANNLKNETQNREYNHPTMKPQK